MHCKNNGQESLLQLQDITEKVFVRPDDAHQQQQQQQPQQQQNTLQTEQQNSKQLTTTTTTSVQPENQTKANNKIGESADDGQKSDTAQTTVAFENGTHAK